MSESEAATVAEPRKMLHAPDAPPQNAHDVPPYDDGHHDQQERPPARQPRPHLQPSGTAAADNALAPAADNPHS